MTGKKKSQRKAAANSEMSASHSANSACPRCHTEVCQADLFIDCDICSCSHHGACTELNGDTFDVLMGIVHETGWVCKDCRLNSRQVIRGLQASCAKLAEEVAGLTVRLNQLEKHGSPSLPAPEQVKRDVWSAVRDCERRSNNIVVSGLPAKNGVEDYILFQSFCEENLQCKPLLNAGKCRRIDKVQPGRVPRLLISFANQSARDDILARSNTLRLSSDSAVKSVYLNPDLSREQAQLAYEKRVKRRANRTAGNHDDRRSSLDDNEHPQLSAAARSFIPVSSE